MSPTGPATAPLARTRRRRRPLVVLAVVVVVLLGLLVVADRVGAYVAEQVAASRLQDSQHLARKPSVDVAGFPFLTQVASSEFGKITVTTHDLDVGESGHQVQLDTLTTVLHDVHTANNFHSVHANTLTATGSTTLARIASATGLDLRGAGTDRVSVTKSVTALGETVSATVSGRPVVRGGALTFDDVRLDNAGSLAAAVSEAASSVFQVSVPLNDIPFGLRATSVSVDGDQVRFALDGSDVQLTDR